MPKFTQFILWKIKKAKLKTLLLIVYFIVHQSCIAQKRWSSPNVQGYLYCNGVIDEIKSYDNETAT